MGYYQFSQDEEQRHEQLAMLGRLREQVGGVGNTWVGLGKCRVSGISVVPLWNVSKGGGLDVLDMPQHSLAR